MSAAISERERCWLAELRSVHVPRMRNSGVIERITAITGRLHDENPGIFTNADMHTIEDITDTVAAMRGHTQEVKMPGIQRVLDVCHSHGIPGLCRESAAASLAVELAITNLVNSRQSLAILFNESSTEWFFDTRGCIASCTAVLEGTGSIHDTFLRSVMTPAIIFIPDHNELTLRTITAVHPEDPEPWEEFASDFASFLVRITPTHPGEVMKLQCSVCGNHTSEHLTHCKACGVSACRKCVQRGCPCGKPTAVKISREDG